MGKHPNGKNNERVEFENLLRVPQKLVAQLFGHQHRAIQWWAKLGCPRNADRTYSLPDVVQWRVEYLATINEDAALESSSQELKDEFLRLKIAHSAADLAIKQQGWAPRSDVSEVLGTIADVQREAIEGANRKFGREVFDFLDEKMGSEVLRRHLKQWMPVESGEESK